MGSPSNAKLTTVLLGTSVVVGFTTYYYYLSKKQKKEFAISSPRDLRHNSYARGSDVVRLYPSACAHGQTFLVTGTTSGLGKQAALLLGKAGALVIMGVRRPEDARELVDDIEASCTNGGCKAQVHALDLASLKSVREFADQVVKSLKMQGRQLNVLINNAGQFGLDGPTEDGFQTVWQVNALAPALLTELLLPVMAADARVVNVSSEVHRFCWSSDIPASCPPPPQLGSRHADYALSKACQVLHARGLNLRFQSNMEQRRAFATEPGLVKTNIGRHLPQFLIQLEYMLLGPFYMRSLDQGCASTLFCALAELEDLNLLLDCQEHGECYFANCAPKRPGSNCTDDDKAKALMALFHSLLAL